MANRTEFSLWLEEALTGWILPVAALAAAGIAAGLYLMGWLSEEATAALGVVAVALGGATLVLRAALGRSGRGATVTLAAAVATALAVALPALPTVLPGKALFEGELGVDGDRIEVPAAASGKVRLLVSGKLRGSGEPSVSYVIGGTEPAVEGRLERVYRSVRVGRGGRGRVAEDHTADWYDAAIPAGTKALTLRRLSGQLGSKLAVSAYRPLLPAPWPWGLAVVALLLAALGEGWLGKKNAVAVPAGMALAFGLLVTANATPYAAVGPVVGAILLGAIAGSLVGWVAGAIARRILAPTP
jgi:hypothetical protein